MKTHVVSNLVIDGPVFSFQLDGENMQADLRDWPDLWKQLSGADLSGARLMSDVIHFPDQDIHIEAVDLLILDKIGEPGKLDVISSTTQPNGTIVTQGFVWEEGFSYREKELIEVEGIIVTRVNIVPDSKNEVPPLYSLPMLSSFVDDSKPTEIWCQGFRYYNNIHKWKPST
ncbi:MAG TPA: hypothetical protein VFO10_02720 [Oligoflexus sp.]|uniref:hypothetical protein n=1 Tax=Oligoflexus sp. TaxID=1971216 RepID=UPI002D8044E4|nr:hypothetical protein [Oligoflexus sp.]HET9236135.1 hypothetical protein [Oligoflexus sp.]